MPFNYGSNPKWGETWYLLGGSSAGSILWIQLKVSEEYMVHEVRMMEQHVQPSGKTVDLRPM